VQHASTRRPPSLLTTLTLPLAICNGIAAYGGFIPFGATFLNFIGYAFGAITLSALSHLQVSTRTTSTALCC